MIKVLRVLLVVASICSNDLSAQSVSLGSVQRQDSFGVSSSPFSLEANVEAQAESIKGSGFDNNAAGTGMSASFLFPILDKGRNRFSLGPTLSINNFKSTDLSNSFTSGKTKSTEIGIKTRLSRDFYFSKLPTIRPYLDLAVLRANFKGDATKNDGSNELFDSRYSKFTIGTGVQVFIQKNFAPFISYKYSRIKFRNIDVLSQNIATSGIFTQQEQQQERGGEEEGGGQEEGGGGECDGPCGVVGGASSQSTRSASAVSSHTLSLGISFFF